RDGACNVQTALISLRRVPPGQPFKAPASPAPSARTTPFTSAQSASTAQRATRRGGRLNRGPARRTAARRLTSTGRKNGRSRSTTKVWPSTLAPTGRRSGKGRVMTTRTFTRGELDAMRLPKCWRPEWKYERREGEATALHE